MITDFHTSKVLSEPRLYGFSVTIPHFFYGELLILLGIGSKLKCRKMKTENIFEWYKRIFTENFTKVNGRLRRKEFWKFIFAGIAILFFSILLLCLPALLFKINFFEILAIILSWLIIIPIAISNICAGIRRLHDTGKSGWWFLINLIPYIGKFVYLILILIDSQKGTNKWGENPKEN